MTTNHTLETVHRLWNVGDSDCIEIGPDSDTGTCVEIRYRDEKGQLSNSARIMLPKQAAALLARAITETAEKLP